jgi:hypothetical protein
MAKINKSNTKLPSLANPCPVEERLQRLIECYKEEEEANCFPVTDLMVQNMAMEIITWADLPGSLILSDFYNPRGHTKKKLQRWAKKYPVFGAAYEYAKDVIGARRIKKRIIETNCDFTMSEYSSEWREKEDLLHERKLEIASKKEKNQPQTINIIQQKAENCPEVPYAPTENKIEDDQP